MSSLDWFQALGAAAGLLALAWRAANALRAAHRRRRSEARMRAIVGETGRELLSAVADVQERMILRPREVPRAEAQAPSGPRPRLGDLTFGRRK